MYDINISFDLYNLFLITVKYELGIIINEKTFFTGRPSIVNSILKKKQSGVVSALYFCTCHSNKANV